MTQAVTEFGPSQGWHPGWEENVYGKGRHLNRYPYHAVVGFVLSNFGQRPDRFQVRILELGCGAGNNLWFAAREGFSVAGIEGSASAVEYARQRFSIEHLQGDIRVGDFSNLPWSDESFDVVLDRCALACTTRHTIESALNESRRVLKPNGKLLSVIYSYDHPGRIFGYSLGDNTYDNFRGGYFFGLGTTHFCTREEIDELFGSRFSISSLVHTIEENHLGSPRAVNAFWRVECVKTPWA
ncbi:MAG: class I SAM-dependent methyltransferase [Acidobacteriota bacterium]